MPSFFEENAPVLTAPSAGSALAGSSSSSPPQSSSSTVVGKSVASKITSRPVYGLLTSVDSNVHINGHSANAASTSAPQYPPPPPPPPSLPQLSFVDDPYGRRPLYSPPSTVSDLSSDSSMNMTGHGGSGSGGAASSHATTIPPDDDRDDDHGEVATNGKLPELHQTSSNSSYPPPTRLPPPPPSQYLPPIATHSFRVPQVPSASSAPSPPSGAPPPPPKGPSDARIPRPAANGAPISVPNPITIPIRPRVVPKPASLSSQSRAQQPHQTWSGTEESDPTDMSPEEAAAQLRYSVASTNASSIQPSPTDNSTYLRSPSRNEGALPATPSRAGPSSQASTLHPQPPTPHRFSSPPAYNPGAVVGSPSAASSGTLHPGPPQPGMKHRHTLEVPRPSPARNSREGADAAMLASGRFSPTAAGSGTGSITGSIGGRRASLSLARRNTRSLHSDLPRDEVVPDEDALRWTEAYRQKRASKRRRMEVDDDQVLVGTKVDETHANWVAAYNMLTGIRVSVSRTNAKLDRPLTDEDFETKQKSTFDIAGNELVPSAKYDFKFKDYAPWVFRHLRALFHLDPADYLMSLAGKYILSELGSPGKSGSFFYFSRDYKYIIKTIHHAEHKFLRRILKDYYQHVTENPNTLLSQFFGLHRVKMPYGRKIHFVVMNNLFPPHRDIHQTFDLKGSTIGRDYPEEQVADHPRATLKDLNWLRRHEHLELGMIKKRLFLEQLDKDVKLLQKLKIMDYSLLVGVHDVRRGNEENLRGKTLQVFEPRRDNDPAAADPQMVLMRTPSKLEHQRKARELRQMLKQERPVPIGESSAQMPTELEDGKKSVFYSDDGGFQATHDNNTPAEEVYYLGVIDCLTHYGMIKKIEHFWKGLSSDREKISALPPQQYGDRFLKFVSGITMSPEEAAQEAQERAAAEAAAALRANTPADGEPAEASTSTTTTAALASGRDKGKELEQNGGGSWSSGMRHRGGGQRTAGEASSSTMAAHRAAEYNAQMASSVPEDALEHITLSTVSTGGGTLLPMAAPDRREPQQQQQSALPILEEAAGEGSSSGSQSHTSRFSTHTADGEADGRPMTPAKDGAALMDGSYGSAVLVGPHAVRAGSSPPTPPTSGYLKPESADSGYGVSGTRSRSGTIGSGRKVKMQMSRDSLEKALPPLPALDRAA